MSGAPLQPGSVLDGYEIVSLLGRGGMGAVYRARRDGVGEVALKTLVGEVTQEERDRFRREAQLLASLRHPAIVPVHTAGEASGLLYFAMGIVEGESLDAKVRREGPLEPAKAVRLLCEIADGVAYANERKIVHRDLKPANVLLDGDGHPLVTDFGLARQLDEKERLTRTGEIMGTPAFMSPEQAFGSTHEIDERTDVYGLGAILYAVLAGRPPFQGGSPFETIKHVRERDPEPIGGAVSAALEDFLVRALAKRPEDRPQTAREFARELEEALHARPPLSRGLLYGLLGVALLALLGTLTLVVPALNKGARKKLETSPSATPPPLEPGKSSSRARVAERIVEAITRKNAGLAKKLWSELPPDDRTKADFLEPLAAYELSVAGDPTKLEQLLSFRLPVATLPTPHDPGDTRKLVEAWLGLARRSSPRFMLIGSEGPQIAPRDEELFRKLVKVLHAASMTDDETEIVVDVIANRIEPVIVAVGRAHKLDPGVGPFPEGTRSFFGNVRFFGDRAAGRKEFAAHWERAFEAYPSHPTLGLIRARTALSGLAPIPAQASFASLRPVFELACKGRDVLKSLPSGDRNVQTLARDYLADVARPLLPPPSMQLDPERAGPTRDELLPLERELAELAGGGDLSELVKADAQVFDESLDPTVRMTAFARQKPLHDQLSAELERLAVPDGDTP